MNNELLSRFIKGVLSTGIGKITTMVLSLLSVVIVTKIITPEEYGGFLLLRVFAMFLYSISTFGLITCLPIAIASAETDDDKRKIVNTIIFFSTSVMLFVGALALIFNQNLAQILGADLIPPKLIAFLPLLYFSEMAYRLVQSMLQSFFKFRQMGENDILLSVLNFSLMILFVVVLQVGAVGLVYARLFAQIVALITGMRKVPIQKRLEFDRVHWRKLMRLGLPLYANDILSFLFNRIDTILVGTLVGSAGVAFYEVGRRIPDNLRMIYDAFRSVFFSFVSKLSADNETERLNRLINTSLRLIASATLLGAFVSVMFAEDIVRILFSAEYLPSAAIFALAMTTLGIRLIGNVLGTALVAMGDTTKSVITSAIYMTASVIGNVLFIPIWGINGAALAALVGVIITNPFDYYFLIRKAPGVRLASYLKPVLIFAVCASLVLIVNPQTIPVFVGLFVLYLSLNVLFSVIKPREISDGVSMFYQVISGQFRQIFGEAKTQ